MKQDEDRFYKLFKLTRHKYNVAGATIGTETPLEFVDDVWIYVFDLAGEEYIHAPSQQRKEEKCLEKGSH